MINRLRVRSQTQYAQNNAQTGNYCQVRVRLST